MTLVIGTDEAGYGPNLGPLVVAATAWHAADDDAPDAGTADPAPRFDRATAALVAACGAAPWADSKRIYQPAGGLGPLEAGVLAALLDCPADGRALADRLAIAVEPPAPPEWPRFLATPLPVAAEGQALERLRGAVADVLPRHGLRLVAIRCRVVQPAAFNALLASGLNKSDILSRTTLDLAATLRAEGAGTRAEIWCDRHGGRKAYAALVGRHFGAALVQTVAETAAVSRYHLPGDRCGIEFAVGGEARVPVALASMTAKYVRELAMAAFNAHWSAAQPGLHPTAGYPLDARRWWREAAATVGRTGLPDDAIWRRA